MKLKMLFQNILERKPKSQSKKNLPVDYTKFLKSLGNLSLIQSFKIKKGDDKSAMQNLEWAQLLYSKMIDKSVHDEGRFQEYFKFQGQEQKSDYPFGYLFDIGYRLKSADNSNYILINKILQFIDSGYKQALNVGNFTLAYAHLQVIVNWNAHLKAIYDSESNQKYILTTLFNINLSYNYYYLEDAHERQLKDGGIKEFIVFRGITSLIFDKKNELLDYDWIQLLFNRLFDHLKFCLQKGRDSDYQDFVHRMMSSVFARRELHTFKNTLYSLVTDKHLDLKHEVRQFAYLEDDIFFKTDLDKINALITELLGKVKKDLNDDDYRNVLQSAQTYQANLIDVLKFNQLKSVIFTSLAYAAFKKNYSLIETVFKIHTPDDANASYGNPDVVDFTIANCLRLIRSQSYFEDTVTFKWDGHHGADIYLYIISLFYLAKSIRKSRNYELNQLNQYIDTLEPAELEWLKDRLSYVENVVLNFIESNKITIPFISKEQINIFLEEGVKSIDRKLKYIISTKQLSENIRQIFNNTVKEEFQNKVFFRNIFLLPDSPKRHGKSKVLSIRTEFSRMVMREPFIENWHVPYYGFYENFSNSLADLEDQNVLTQIKPILKKGKTLDRLNIVDQLTQEGIGKNVIIVAVNLSLYSILYKTDQFKNLNPSSENSNTKFKTGYFKEAPIFETYLTDSSCLILLDINKIKTNGKPIDLETQLIDVNLESDKLKSLRPQINVQEFQNNLYVSAETVFEISMLPNAGVYFEISD